MKSLQADDGPAAKALCALLRRDGFAEDVLQMLFLQEKVLQAPGGELALPVRYNELAAWLRLQSNDNDDLTVKEQALLEALRRAGPQGMSGTELLSEVWRSHPEVDTHTVETHVWRLRRKRPGLILTAVGGRYVAEVELEKA